MGRSYRASDGELARIGKELAEWARFKHHQRSLFGDIVEMWAIALLNGFMPKDAAWLNREKRFSAFRAMLNDDGYDLTTRLFSQLALVSQQSRGDWLGELYHQFEANSKSAGQFFTPYSVSSMMARMTFTKDTVDKAIDKQGYVTMQEPACGAGGMVIAAAEAIEALGYDPKQVLRVHALDIDRIPINMTLVQTSLQGVPCYVEQANSFDPTSGDRINYRFPNVHFAAASALAA